jgi:hypothetical protein
LQSRISEPGAWSLEWVWGYCCCVADPVSSVQANLHIHLAVRYGVYLLNAIKDWLEVEFSKVAINRARNEIQCLVMFSPVWVLF